MESYVQDLADMPPGEAQSPMIVDPLHYRALLEIVELLRPSKFHHKFGWKDLKLLALSHLENAGYKFDAEKNVLFQMMDRNQPGRASLFLRIKPEMFPTYVRTDVAPGDGVVHGNPLDVYRGDVVVPDIGLSRDGGASAGRQVHLPIQLSFSPQIQDASQVLNDLKALDSVKSAGERWSPSINGIGQTSIDHSASGSSQKLVNIGDDSVVMAVYQQQQQQHQASGGLYPIDGLMNFSQLPSHSTATNKMHAGFTLDDIQQVLSATQTSCDSSSASGTEIPMDERKLREITAFLLGRHPDGLTTFTAGVCPVPSGDGGAIQATFGGGDSITCSAVDGLMHQADNALQGTNSASIAGFSAMDSVLPHGGQSDDMQFSTISSSSSSLSPVPGSSMLVSSQKEVFGIAKVTGPSAMVLPPSAFSAPANCLGSTILVTESNLPYLQKFLPNLQTVMQSVQSLVRGGPSQSDGLKPNDSMMTSADNSASSSDMIQEVPNVAVSAFGTVPLHEPSPLKHRVSSTMTAPAIGIVDSTSTAFSDEAQKTDYSINGGQDVLEDPFAAEGALRPKDKCRLGLKEPESEKFYCRFCRRGFLTIAQRRRHTEWLCQKKKAAQPAAQATSSLKCEQCGKTFVSKSGHTTHMMRVHAEQKPSSASSRELDGAASVRLPEDVTLKDCFVKIVRMNKEPEGDLDEEVGMEGVNEDAGVGAAKDSPSCQSDEACMCDSCGELFPTYDKLAIHQENCVITIPMPMEESASSDQPRSDFDDVDLFKQGDSISVMAVNNADQSIAYCGSNPVGSVQATNGRATRPMLGEHNTFFVQNPGQLSTLAVHGSTGVKQGAVLEMLQLAEHFLRHNTYVANNASGPKVLEQAPQNDFRPRLEIRSVPNAVARSQFASPTTTSPRLNHQVTEVSHQQSSGLFSPQPAKRVILVRAPVKNEAVQGVKVAWTKPEPEKIITSSNFQSNMKPDVISDGCMSVGKEILYEGTRMHEYVEYQCETCLLTFNESASANAHIEASDHGNSSVASYHVYVCTGCSIKYRDKQVMRNHILYICTGSRANALPSGRRKDLHRCSLCTKAFISSEFLQVHLNLKHGASSKVTSPVQPWLSVKMTSNVDVLASQTKNSSVVASETVSLRSNANSLCSSSPTARKPLWSSDTTAQTAAVSGASQPYLFASPSAVSIPTLEQLTSGYRKASTEAKDLKFPDLASSHQTSEIAGPLGSSVPDILASIPEHGDGQKQTTTVAASSTDIRQLIGNAQGANLKQRSSKAKGILYKNVFMQCEGTYFCSVCKADLSSRESKKSHRQMPCGDPRTITYSRKYSYLCPYCMERFPSQKTCRQHQVTECLPLIGISTEELSVKELICPLCPKKYFNLIPLKGHMTQVHKLPKAETREMLHRLGYMDPNVSDDQSKTPSDGYVHPDGILQHHKLSSSDFVSGDQNSSTDVEFAQRSMLFDFENDVDVSSECAVQGQDILMQNSGEPCPEMEVIYDGEIFADQEVKKLKSHDVDLAGAEELEISSVMLSAEQTRLEGYNGPERNSSLGIDQYLSGWPDESSGPLSETTIVKNQSFLQESAADSTVSPEQKRRKPRQTNEFFVMMFRNYPILAKGVSICAGCQLQMSSNSEVDNHINSAVCTGPDGRPADVKRSTIFKCTHCEKTFWKAKTCRQHQLDTCLPLHGVEVDNLVQPSVACPLCAAKSYNRSGLMSHMKYKHGMDTKGVRDIMEQYGIHKKTADILPPSLATTSNGLSGHGAAASANVVGVDGGKDLSSSAGFLKPPNHLELSGNEKLGVLENASGLHPLSSENPQLSPSVGEPCPVAQQYSMVSTVAIARDHQFEVQRLYTTVGSMMGKDRDHVNIVGASFNSIT